MSDALLSPSWYRVAGLKPRIRAHVEIHRHAYRGKVWFVLQDHAAGRSHRFSPAAHQFIGLMDGERTVQQLWDAVCAQLGDAAPTQEEVIRLLGQLHSADALLCDVPPDSLEVFRRHQKHERMEWRRRLWTPLAIRLPIFDPDRFLERTLPFVQPLFGPLGLLLWLAVVGTGLVLAVSHWTDLTEDVVDRVLAPQNLLLLWLVYPAVKALHELGHAYATKKWGGEVHEIGIMLLVLTPVPYVDASAAWGFREKGKRVVVGAAGMAVELFLGALALFVWLSVEPGAVSSIAYNVMLISGISTLLFNGNPLLRFDGYYVLADAIEIPNLGTRANKYLGYLYQRYLCGVADAENPAESPGERAWMVAYGIAAFLYRIFILFVIILFIAGKFFLIGVLLAIWAVATQVVVPMGKSLSFLATSPGLRRQRGRVMSTSVLLALALLGLVFVAPAPSWTSAQGVLWVPEEAQVRAGTEGFVERLLAPADSTVARGQPLIEARDPFLQTRVAVLQAQLKELGAQFDALILQDRVQAAMVREEMAAVAANLERARQRQTELIIRSPADGRFVAPSAADLPGRFVTKGQLVAYVVEPKALTARVVLSQDDIGLVRQRTRSVEVMLAAWGADPLPARIQREVPGGSRQLPTPALGSAGGGPFAVDPRDEQGVRTLARVFQLELALPPEVREAYLGARIFVRFDHGTEPVGFQVYRALRQLLLRQFDV
ncbi:MAG TPA: HlyD family efflux transporter periplasmic adaptor subunit [Burkholderiales bacterium]|nr:HlyD family efflux transporter periplasmic adaptor subunit [Burkholderiales bacterium]